MNSLTYVAQSLPWTIAGLLVGYFMARATVAVEAIADAVQEEPTMPDPRPKGRRRFTAVHVIGLVLVILGLATAIQGYVVGQRTERLTACLQTYSNGFADAIDQRAKANAEAQKASDDLWLTFATVAPTPEARDIVKRALDDYVAKRKTAIATQEEHPYPAAPRDLCK